MKERISVTIDGDVKGFLEDVMKKGNYRNKSHVVETALKFFMAKEREKVRNQRLTK